MGQEFIDGYVFSRKHDFEVDVINVNYANKHIHLYVWIVNNTPEFLFITSNHINRGLKVPSSGILIDTDNQVHIKHDRSKWFRANEKDIKICNAIIKAFDEWSIEKILIGGNYEAKSNITASCINH